MVSKFTMPSVPSSPLARGRLIAGASGIPRPVETERTVGQSLDIKSIALSNS
jgi:hypothetical protein